MRPALILAVVVLGIAGIYATWTHTRNTADMQPSPPGPSAGAGERIGNLERVNPPAAVPDLTVVDAAGAQHSLKDFAGKFILVNFWATWCAPCREEMPSLDRLQARLGGPDFQVVPISLDRGGMSRVESFLKDNGIRNLTSYLDPGTKSLALFGFPGLPTSILINAKGQEVARLIGPTEWDSPKAIAAIDALRGKDTAPVGAGSTDATPAGTAPNDR
jgi:thiol-disulfide isomerase/thioredoxin